MQVKTFDISEVRMVIYDGRFGPEKRHVCPDCVNHKQEKPAMETDCKNLFKRDGEVVSQCCCWCKDHDF